MHDGRDTTWSASGTALAKLRVPAALRGELQLWTPFLVLIFSYVATVGWIAAENGLWAHFRLGTYRPLMQFSIILTVFLAITGYLLYLGFGEREKRPLRRLAADLWTHILPPERLAGMAIPLLAIPFLVGAFSSFKAMIPLLNPFYLDPIFAEIDRVLHFGIAPWEITHAVFSGPWTSLLIQFVYNSWFLIMWVFMLGHILWITAPRERARYLLSFALCWTIVGSVFAFLLSSAGPCFYGRVVDGPDIFAPLMHRLEAINAPLAALGDRWTISALWLQDLLWHYHTQKLSELGSGISAMPSMHVSIAVLMALAARRFSMLIGRILAVFAVLIMIGSVHLGWHYAIDGYVAAALTFAIWKLSGWLVARTGAGPKLP